MLSVQHYKPPQNIVPVGTQLVVVMTTMIPIGGYAAYVVCATLAWFALFVVVFLSVEATILGLGLLVLVPLLLGMVACTSTLLIVHRLVNKSINYLMS
jgi:hypothetical protein